MKFENKCLLLIGGADPSYASINAYITSMSNIETLECVGKLSGEQDKEPRCYSWPSNELALCGWDFRYTITLPVVQLAHILLANLTSENIFETEQTYLRGIWTP